MHCLSVRHAQRRTKGLRGGASSDPDDTVAPSSVGLMQALVPSHRPRTASRPHAIAARSVSEAEAPRRLDRRRGVVGLGFGTVRVVHGAWDVTAQPARGGFGERSIEREGTPKNDYFDDEAN